MGIIKINYNNNSIYYKCIENCENCSNGTSCNKCKQNFDYYNNKCIEKINNCKEYDTENNCIKCIDNYAFKEDDRNNCLYIENFTEFYSKDKGISYFPCDGEDQDQIKSCQNCYYNQNISKLSCYKCKNDNVLIIDLNRCDLNETIENDHSYYYINQTHAKQCSSSIINCEECTNEKICNKCIKDFYLFNNDTDNCINITKLDNIDEYYLDEKNTTYYSCNNINYNSIKNCKKCLNKDSCLFCKDNFTFIDGNKTNCIEKESIKDKYIPDPSDLSNYIKCDNFINNCNLCNSSQCFLCNDEYVFINDNFTKCVLKSSLDLNIFFTDDNKMFYSCQEEKYKNNKKCKLFINTTIISHNLKLETTTPKIINTYKQNESTIPKSNLQTQDSTNPKIIDINNQYKSTILKSNVKILHSTNPKIVDSDKQKEPSILKSNLPTQDSTNLNIIDTNKQNKSTLQKSNLFTQESTTPKIIDTNKQNESTISKSNIKATEESTTPKIIDTNKQNESTVSKSNLQTQESTTPKIIDTNKQNESTISKSNLQTQESTTPKIINTNKQNESTISKSNIKTQESTIPKIIDSYIQKESSIPRTNFKIKASTIPIIINSYKSNQSTIPYSNIISKLNLTSSTINQTFIGKNTFIENSSLPIINSISNINNRTLDTNTMNSDSIITVKTSLEYNSGKSTIISTILNITQTDNVTYISEIPSTLLNYTEIPNIIYTIFILQTQLINNFIRMYILSDFPIKRNTPLTFISKLYYQNLRNLQQEKGEDVIITLYATEDFDKDKIAVFSSNDQFNNVKRIKGQEVKFDNKGYNDVKINLLNNNKDCLDTEKVENLIKQGGLDYSNLPSDYKIKQYKINSASQGCNFDLESNSTINEDKKEIKLNFKNDKLSDVKANCILSKNNENSNLIPCTLNKNIDSYYILEDYILSNNKETITIMQSNKSRELYLNCDLNNLFYKDSEKGGMKTGVIICIIIIGILLLLGIIVLSIYCHNKKKSQIMIKSKTNSFYPINLSSYASDSQL